MISSRNLIANNAAQKLQMINNSFQIINKRFKASKAESSLPGRMSKPIKPGHARPAMYYKFDVMVQLSDGSVIKRKSQYPKSELKSLQDQRNTPLWNPARKDLVVLDVGSGKVDKFKERYNIGGQTPPQDAQLANKKTPEESVDTTLASEESTIVAEAKQQENHSGDDTADAFDMSDVDDYLDLLGTSESTGEVQKGGKVAVKKKNDDKKKK